VKQSKKTYLVDTNVLLRYLIGDGAQKAEKAMALMERVEHGSEEVEICSVIVAEMIWTLEKFYEVPRRDIAQKLLVIFSFKGVKGVERPMIVAALQSYGSTNIDFVDCYLAARGKGQNMPVYSFDKKDFSRLDIPWAMPQ